MDETNELLSEIAYELRELNSQLREIAGEPTGYSLKDIYDELDRLNSNVIDLELS